ncbi:hypothetical protein QE383_001206 [Pseudoxanthomonas winnipegensis]|uniref:Uncharacterized protein n=1 Tax=Pseudoxanthomonas winnipegensis TaxID=2480810 RepID=A0AAW8GBC2_9GAMM|nr:hypothetical protein [Pseudoxanthomonas winnipegensis]MDQ1132086.1 hypothetical protein [Pseudoxanthomonas winnipegensis]
MYPISRNHYRIGNIITRSQIGRKGHLATAMHANNQGESIA